MKNVNFLRKQDVAVYMRKAGSEKLRIINKNNISIYSYTYKYVCIFYRLLSLIINFCENSQKMFYALISNGSLPYIKKLAKTMPLITPTTTTTTTTTAIIRRTK
ncbi:unnamed protein product [Ceratitis capitata]|uniref:(Mediterranean fruit fly) hypothetical protein n=1 Tax=Ceratitis capitata TaxID=7213 RepID=A0A811U6K4_CERCA|nr:unnamed protein product [Ceratitis capitata]